MPGQEDDHKGYSRTVADILDAFSVISFTIDEQIAEGETVVTKYAERSVIRGEAPISSWIARAARPSPLRSGRAREPYTEARRWRGYYATRSPEFSLPI
jgi:hypothetical protein